MKIQFKSTLRVVFISLVIILSAKTNFAQNKNRQQQAPNLPDSTQIVKMVDDLSTELNLSKVQKSKISEMYFIHFNELKIARKNNKDKQPKSREEMNAVRQKFENQVKTQLSKEQLVKYEKFLQTRKHPQGQGNIQKSQKKQ